MKKYLSAIASIVYPPTKAKLHRIVTVAGVCFTVATIVATWWGELGLSVEGKIGATIGMLTTLAAGWKRAKPKIDEGIDALPIPADDKGFAGVLVMGALAWIVLGVYLASRHCVDLAARGQ